MSERQKTVPFTLPNRGGLLAVGALVLGLVGCEKPAPPPPPPLNPEAVMSQAGAGLTTEDVVNLQKIAQERLAAKIDAEPAYDRKKKLRELLAEKYKIDLDKQFPDGVDTLALKDRAQIEGEVRRLVNRRADVQYPPEKRQMLVEESEVRYPLRKVGETITITLISDRTVEGEITEIGPNHVKVKDRIVVFDDIKSPDTMAFDPETTAQRRERHVDMGYDIDRKKFVDQAMATELPKALRENGFVLVNSSLMRIDQVIESLQPLVDEAERLAMEKRRTELKAEVEKEMIEDGIVGSRITGITPPKPKEEAASLLHDMTLTTGDLFPGYVGYFDGDTFISFDADGARREWNRQLIDAGTQALIATYGDGSRDGADGLQPRVQVGANSLRLPNGLVVVGFDDEASISAVVFSRPPGANPNFRMELVTEIRGDALEVAISAQGEEATPATLAQPLLTAFTTLCISNLATNEALDLKVNEVQVHGDLTIAIQHVNFGTADTTESGAMIVVLSPTGLQCARVFSISGDAVTNLNQAIASLATLQF